MGDTPVIPASTIPRDFCADAWHIGIKEDAQLLDFAFLHSQRPCHSAAVFTQNRFPGWPVVLGRAHAACGTLRTLIVNSGNANTATGDGGLLLARKCCELASQSLGIEMSDVLPASTGIIGRPLHNTEAGLALQEACRTLHQHSSKQDFLAFAAGICTTDAFLKVQSHRVGRGSSLLGIAKGAGMIAPNMATMLAFICTDACISQEDLQNALEFVTQRTFNCITVDSDTSTSDTFAILANQSSPDTIDLPLDLLKAAQTLAHPISIEDLEALVAQRPSIAKKIRDIESSLQFLTALLQISTELAKLIVRDGEGSTKLLELQVSEAKDTPEALAIGRAILNSPLIKTAMYGGDQNWGRFLMAIGKVCSADLSLDAIQIRIGEYPLKPDMELRPYSKALHQYLKGQNIQIFVALGNGNAKSTLWGCDLSPSYIHLNSAYST